MAVYPLDAKRPAGLLDVLVDVLGCGCPKVGEVGAGERTPELPAQQPPREGRLRVQPVCKRLEVSRKGISGEGSAAIRIGSWDMELELEPIAPHVLAQRQAGVAARSSFRHCSVSRPPVDPCGGVCAAA